ncbi:hypothetical protein [uncultured Selenomonas sp.]|uniref:hypothetical protein n=1 Tax=uncultured Selenomonas sp. TaxID=159275 RepID=UPI00258F7130|nr:hypothetical protein [uncultured Selenomonas sp.]
MGQNKTLGMLGVLGGAVLKGTTTIVGKTAEKAGEISDTVQEDRRKYSFIKEQNEENKRLMEKSTEAYRRTEIILHQEAEQLDHIRGQIIRDFKEIHTILSAEQHAAAQAERNIRDIDGLNMSTSLFAGVAGGGLAAGTVVGLVATFCTAGTGAAISGLSGTYAVNATLAALGGGTLAAGGMGITGGIVVASSLFALPALTVGGAIVHKKIAEMEQKTHETTELVRQAVEENRRLSERNLAAADRLRSVFSVGVSITFFLRFLRQRLHNAPQAVQPKLQTVVRAAEEKLGKMYLTLKPLEENGDSRFVAEETLRDIEEDCRTLECILWSDEPTVYNGRNSTEAFRKIYEDAREYIYLSFPWYNNFCVEQDIALMQAAAKRGVRIFIYYGIGDRDERAKKTERAIARIKETLPADAVHFYRQNSHMKIAVCERYVIHGSQNLMTYRYDSNRADQRAEVTVKTTSISFVEEMKNLIVQQERQ